MLVLWNILFLCQVDKIKAEIQKPWKEKSAYLLMVYRTAGGCFWKFLFQLVGTVVVSHSFISWSASLDYRKADTGQKLPKWWEDISVVKLSFREWKGKGLLCAWVATHSAYLGLGWGFVGWFVLEVGVTACFLWLSLSENPSSCMLPLNCYLWPLFFVMVKEPKQFTSC